MDNYNKSEVERELTNQFIEFLKVQKDPRITVDKKVIEPKTVGWGVAVEFGGIDKSGSFQAKFAKISIVVTPIFYYKNRINQIEVFWEKKLFNYILGLKIDGHDLSEDNFQFVNIALFKSKNESDNKYDEREILLVSLITE